MVTMIVCRIIVLNVLTDVFICSGATCQQPFLPPTQTQQTTFHWNRLQKERRGSVTSLQFSLTGKLSAPQKTKGGTRGATSLHRWRERRQKNKDHTLLKGSDIRNNNHCSKESKCVQCTNIKLCELCYLYGLTQIPQKCEAGCKQKEALQRIYQSFNFKLQHRFLPHWQIQLCSKQLRTMNFLSQFTV